MSDDTYEPVARTLISQGLQLRYLDWGNEGAPLLFLIHGNGDHARSWDWTARALRGDYHVIAPDLRGHGDSAWSSDGAYMTPYFLLDFVNLVDGLGADMTPESITLIGHSFGGVLATRFAALYPGRVRKLVLVDGLGPAPSFTGRWAEEGSIARARVWIAARREAAKRQPKRFANLEEAAQRLRKEQTRLTDERALHLARHGLRADGDALVWKRDPLVSVYASDEDFALENDNVRADVAAPTLLFWGPESWTTHPDEDGRAKAIRDHKTIVFQDAGHWLHHDQFEAFMAELRAFL
jgi:pimeloyl-ACP methyl ester carboxylesterase